jgi:hypothetical protein
MNFIRYTSRIYIEVYCYCYMVIRSSPVVSSFLTTLFYNIILSLAAWSPKMKEY